MVHSGIDQAQFHPVPTASGVLTQKYGISWSPDRFDLLYVGNEAPHKNLETLLRAMVWLRDQGVESRLLKVGSPGQPHYRTTFLTQVSEYGLEDNVGVMGWVADADLPLFYSAADVVVLPSLMEGFGMPLLEALACGTPVVCSRAGSLPEVGGSAALYFEPGCASALGEKVAMLLLDEGQRRYYQDLGRQRAAQFSWEQTAARTIAVYRLAAGDRI